MSTQSISPASAAAQFTYFPVPFHLQNAQYAAWPAGTAAAPAVSPVPAYNAIYPMPQIEQVYYASCTLRSEFQGLCFW